MQKTIHVPIDTPEQIEHLLANYKAMHKLILQQDGDEISVLAGDYQNIIYRLEERLQNLKNPQ